MRGWTFTKLERMGLRRRVYFRRRKVVLFYRRVFYRRIGLDSGKFRVEFSVKDELKEGRISPVSTGSENLNRPV